jgi:hypothetical protein
VSLPYAKNISTYTEKLQGEGVKNILTTVFIGIISGIVGILLRACYYYQHP